MLITAGRLSMVASVLLLAGAFPASGAPIAVEGEAYAAEGGPSRVQVVEREQASGGKLVSYWEEAGVWLEWEVDLPAAGRYALSFRYACAYPDTERQVSVDGRPPEGAAQPLRFAGTGTWGDLGYATLTDGRGAAVVLPLAAGRHRLRLTNANSRGLAIDQVVLHDPAQRFTDVALSSEEVAALDAALLPTLGVNPLPTDVMALGSVRVLFDGPFPSALEVSGTRFTGSRTPLFRASAGDDGLARVSPAPTATAEPRLMGRGRARMERTRGLLARVQMFDTPAGLGLLLAVTDGKTLTLAAAAPGEGWEGWPLWPAAYRDGAGWRHAVLWDWGKGARPLVGGGAGPAGAWRVGSARITAAPAIMPGGGLLGIAAPARADAQPTTGSPGIWGPGRVTALKIGPPAWDLAGLEVAVEAERVLSTAKDFPALARFYGYGRFTAEFTFQGSIPLACIVTDLDSGQVIRFDLTM